MPHFQAHQPAPPSSSPPGCKSSFVTCHISKFTNPLLPLPPLQDVCNRPRASPALVSSGTGQYDETFTLSPSRSCMISFGAASCSLMTSSYRCHCLVSFVPFCIGVICSLARSVLDLSVDTYLYHRSQLPCTCSPVV